MMKMNRRKFLRTGTAVGAGLMAGAGCVSTSSRKAPAQVMTVLGPLRARQMGPTLPHEHVFLDFIGAEEVSRSRYDAEEVFEVALPQLQLVRDFGCQTVVECTPAYIGRDPMLLKRLAEASELHLLTNTGYYGAGNNRYLPRHAWTETADELATRWLTEWRDGIEGTGVRPGFIKIGVNAGPLSDLHRTLVRAAARTHLASGLTIAAHTGNGAAMMDELSVLREEGVAPSAFIWVHAQNENDTDLYVRAASTGAWVEFDNVSPKTVGRHIDLVKQMKSRELLHRVLVSHDAGWYEAGKPRGGEYRPYDTIFKELLPGLKSAGFTAAEIEQLIVVNPREAFTLRIRSTHTPPKPTPPDESD
jgi:phosphotriesterase-related protein